MGWIRYKSPLDVRGEQYDTLMNIENGAVFLIDTVENQPDSDLSLHVWVEFPGMDIKRIFKGTPVECMRVIDKFAAEYGAKELTAWG